MTRHGPIIVLVLAIAACPVLAAEDDGLDPRVIHLTPPGSKSLDAEMQLVLRGLVKAALESDGTHIVVDSGLKAGWDLKLEAAGRGTKKISATLESLGAPTTGSVETAEYSFSDREELTRAVDDLVAELAGGWPGEEVKVVPVSMALSPSTLAVDAYLNAIAAFRRADMATGRERLDEALAIDPEFVLAAAEKTYLDLTEGKGDEATNTLRRFSQGRRSQSVRSTMVIRGLDLIVHNRAMAIPATTKIVEESGLLRWGGILRGMARLAEQAAGGPQKPFPPKPEQPAKPVDGVPVEPPPEPPKPVDPLGNWKRVVSIDAGDPRAQFWLGRAQMSIGQLTKAAATFSTVTDSWPALLDARVLRAEVHVRKRKTGEARSVLEQMKQFQMENAIPVQSARTDPVLMLGSIHLMEGNFDAAFSLFEQNLEELTTAGAPHQATAVLYKTLIEMIRDSAIGRDPLFKKRTLDEARRMLARYEESMTFAEGDAAPWEILRLRGHIDVKEGDTVEAWKLATQIRSYRDRPGYSEYHASYLEGATMLKEGDLAGSIEAFDKVARVRGSLVDMIDLGQLQLQAKRFEAARATFMQVGEVLGRFAEPAAGPIPHGNELILAEPHLASLIPVYHYFRARLAYLIGKSAESRRYFNRMLTYFTDPGPRVMGMVKEGLQRGAKAEGSP